MIHENLIFCSSFGKLSLSNREIFMKKLLSLLITFVWFLIISGVSTAAAGPTAKQPVILDTDMTYFFDDGVAMMMLALAPNSELLGVTTVVGNTWPEEGTASALHQLAGIHRTDIPVMMGSRTPLRRNRYQHLEQELVQFGQEGNGYLGAFSHPEPKDWLTVYQQDYGVQLQQRPSSEKAADFIIRQVQARPHEITILAIGPCTNLATALKKAPEIAPLVKQVIYMGGAFWTAGNVTPSAELNFWYDPEAAKISLRAPFPEQIVIPLDACDKIRLDYAKYQDLGNRIKSPRLQKLWQQQWLASVFKENHRYSALVWDILTAAVFLDPTAIVQEKNCWADVNDTYSLSYGQSLAYERRGPAGSRRVRIVQAVDEKKVMKMLDTVFDKI